jgi:transcriptional regulator with XRE-family HTH domain
MTGLQFRRYCKRKRITQAQVARDLDVCDRTVRRWARDGTKRHIELALYSLYMP